MTLSHARIDARSALLSLTFLLLAAPLAACGDNLTAAKPQADAGTPVDGPGQDDGGPVSSRTMTTRPLFGDTHAPNLFIDPAFSVRMGGYGNWMPITSDASQGTASFRGSPMSDSPAGIAMPVGRLADATGSSDHYQLDLLAQVAGGPGPYHLRVWISTLDATASASIDGVSVGVLTSLTSSLIGVQEDPTKAQVIAGRTWHLFTGQISQSLSLGGFVLLDFPASANTWLVQSPEFIPAALDPSSSADKARRRPALQPRPMTTRERQILDRYRRQPRLSVPAGHRALRDEARPRDRR